VKYILLSLLAICAWAAEPDWTALDKYAVDLLQRYVRIASVNPPADTRPTAALLQSELARYGIAARIYSSGPNGQTDLLARLPGRDHSKKPLLLLNHMDVVPVDAKAWKLDPFGGLIRGGFLWGRGALDMKSNGILQLVAMAALRQAGIVPARDILFLATADEEASGIYGARWMIENHFEEIDPEYVLDEGGLGSREVLSTGKLVFGVAVGEKLPVWLRLRAQGTSGHGSQPIPDNANMILIQALERALAAPRSSQPHPVVAEMMRTLGSSLASNKFTSAIQRNTISLTTLSAGVGSPRLPNVIPSTSEATLDCRLLPGVNPQEFISELKARINDPRVTVEMISHPTEAGVSSSRTPLFGAIRQAIGKHHPDALVTPILVPFSTDSSKFRRKGVVAYGFLPMTLDFATFSSMHGDAERIPVDEFLTGLRIYFDVLRSEF
jgi:acetylornithine deacetylase/succinyl-diaminopimelate desuccinylase-like protein